MEELIERLLDPYPDLLSSQDLVRIGLFKNIQMAHYMRSIGNSPPFMKVGQKVLYPKEGVQKFMLNYMHSGKNKDKE